MLILTRRAGEAVMIGEEVVFTVVAVKGDQARVGIQAPREIPVHRGEIYQRILREQAAQSAPPGSTGLAESTPASSVTETTPQARRTRTARVTWKGARRERVTPARACASGQSDPDV